MSANIFDLSNIYLKVSQATQPDVAAIFHHNPSAPTTVLPVLHLFRMKQSWTEQFI